MSGRDERRGGPSRGGPRRFEGKRPGGNRTGAQRPTGDRGGPRSDSRAAPRDVAHDAPAPSPAPGAAAPPTVPSNIVRLRTVVSPSGPWIFRKMVREASPRTEPGAIVKVLDREEGFVAWAFWNPDSELALRVLTRDKAEVNEQWLRVAVRRAVAMRRDILQLDRVTNAWRAVFSDADNLPGLVVDRYGDVLSCQVSTLGVYRHFGVLADELKRELKASVLHVTSDAKVAKIEGFPILAGAGGPVRAIVREHGLEFDVDCAEGHKTGFFLDQRESRRRIRDLAKGRRMLDLCCYTGGFSLNAAKGEAATVTGVDLDEDAIAQATKNAARNGLTERVRFAHADVFGFLRALAGGEHGLIVVDPAKQAMRREDRERAIHYYRDLNQLVFEKAAPDALVLSCSCTGLVSEQDFLAALAQAAVSARRQVTFLEVRGAPADHPVPADFPQARYLKNVLCRVQ